MRSKQSLQLFSNILKELRWDAKKPMPLICHILVFENYKSKLIDLFRFFFLIYNCNYELDFHQPICAVWSLWSGCNALTNWLTRKLNIIRSLFLIETSKSKMIIEMTLFDAQNNELKIILEIETHKSKL